MMKENNYISFLASLGIGGAHPGVLPLTQEIQKKLNIVPNDKVLDVGCGTGISSVHLSKKYQCHVTALDNHPLMIKRAQERFTREKAPIELIKGEAGSLPFSDHLFYLILAESVTVFSSSIFKTLNEYFKVMRPGGVLINIEMTVDTFLSEKSLEEIQTFYGISEILSQEQWINRLQSAGCSKVDILKRKQLPLISKP